MVAIQREKYQLRKLGPQEELGPVLRQHNQWDSLHWAQLQLNQQWDHQQWDSLHWAQLQLLRRLDHDRVSHLDWESQEEEMTILARRSQYLRHRLRREVSRLQPKKR